METVSLASHYRWEIGIITPISQKQKLRPRKVEKGGKVPSAAKGRARVPIGSLCLGEARLVDILTLGLRGSQADCKIRFSFRPLALLPESKPGQQRQLSLAAKLGP